MFATKTKSSTSPSKQGQAVKFNDPAYERKKLREATRQRKLSASGREIGDLPAVQNPQRKHDCERNFRLFCESYFPDAFNLAWSADHLTVLAAIERTVLEGGMFALAMPRGSGKTTLCEVACVWAALYGHHQFIVLIGADGNAASESLEAVCTYLQTNEQLAADFPEVCYPFQKMEGIQQRRLLYHGKRVTMRITKHGLTLPDIPGSRAANVIFRVSGIEGRIRGMKFVRPDKRSVRPTLAVIDDPQTDKTSLSERMCASREKIVSKAVKGLAGPGKRIAVLVPCTVIRRGDVADRLLNRELHPAFHGHRMKLVYQWPTRMDLWEEYIKIRHDCQRRDVPTTPATDFYRRNRATMDEGAIVAWPARHEPDQLSALEHAMCLRFENKEGAEDAFQCEFQNEPNDEQEGTEKLPRIEVLQTHVSTLQRRQSFPQAVHMVAAIDVQQEALFWQVDGFEQNYSKHTLDYNIYPEQPLHHFALRTISHTLSLKYPKAHADGRLYRALTDLVETLIKAEYKTGSGSETHRIERIGIDSSYKTALIHRFCRESPHAAMLYPTHGKGIKVTQLPLRLYKMNGGERLFDLCALQKGTTKARTTRHLIIDTNAAKTFVFERFDTEIGDPGAVQLFADHPTRHRLYFEHLTAEYRKRLSHNDREIEEWFAKPGKPDNHWLDTTVINYALANSLGCKLSLPVSMRPKKKRKAREAEYL